MGSWNKTCALTNLPIRSGEEVYVFLLEESMFKSERCYASSFWTPVLLPFAAKYDDYGAAEDVDMEIYNVLHEGLKKLLVEVEQDPNQYNNSIKKEDFTVDTFFEEVHENRLKITPILSDKQVEVDFVMIKKSSADLMLQKFNPEMYLNKDFANVNYSDSVLDVPAYISALKACEHRIFIEGVGYDFPKITNSFDSDHRNASIFGKRDLVNLICAGHENSQKICELFLLGNFINIFFNCTRRIWTPMCHEGRQSQCYDEFEILADVIKADIQEHRHLNDEE